MNGPPFPKLFLTGERGVGKSTIVRRVAGALDVPVGGFTTERLFTGGRHSGFVLKDLMDGRTAIIAELDDRGALVSRPEGFEGAGVNAIEGAVAGRRLVVMDELGFLERDAPRFREAVLRALGLPVAVLGVLKELRDPFLEKVKACGIVLLTVRREDREGTEREVLRLIRGEAARTS
jgi:nucleoside-triphosphatase